MHAPTTEFYSLTLHDALPTSPNGKVYVMGGRHGTDGEDVALQWIWEYNPSADTWTRKNALLDGSQPGSRYTANMAVAVLTRSEEHTSELQSQSNLVCRLLLDQ